MKIQLGSSYLLKDLHGHTYGEVIAAQFDGQWIIGKFEAGPDFQSVKPLFMELEEAANGQIISIIDGLIKRIDELDLHLFREGSVDSVKVYDVQIMNKTDICFKVHR